MKIKDILSDGFWIMPSTPKFDENGEIPYITSKNIKVGEIDFSNVQNISKKDYEVISKNRPIKTNDILISMIGTLGNIAVVKDCDGVFYGQNMYLLRLNTDIVNIKYFYNFFTSDVVKRHIKSQMNKSTQGYLKANHIEEIDIPIPNLTEQEKISNKFEKINLLIDIRKQQISKLDELVKSRFIELFGDPLSNPMRWKKEQLQSNATLLNGRAYKQDELLDSGKYPVLRVGNFFSNRSWYYSDLELDDDKYCDNGDLLYAWSASFGPKIWSGGKVIYHYHIWKVLVGENYNKQFLCNLLDYVTASLMGDTHGIGMMHLTKSGMEETEFIVPPIDLQNQFAAFVEQTDKSKLTVQKSLEQLETLKKSLMQQYFG